MRFMSARRLLRTRLSTQRIQSSASSIQLAGAHRGWEAQESAEGGGEVGPEQRERRVEAAGHLQRLHRLRVLRAAPSASASSRATPRWRLSASRTASASVQRGVDLRIPRRQPRAAHRDPASPAPAPRPPSVRAAAAAERVCGARARTSRGCCVPERVGVLSEDTDVLLDCWMLRKGPPLHARQHARERRVIGEVDARRGGCKKQQHIVDGA